MPALAFLFTLGAAASLIGDHSHVATGTTEYLTDAVPFIWSSPIWFPLLVGAATVSLADAEGRPPLMQQGNQNGDIIPRAAPATTPSVT